MCVQCVPLLFLSFFNRKKFWARAGSFFSFKRTIDTCCLQFTIKYEPFFIVMFHGVEKFTVDWTKQGRNKTIQHETNAVSYFEFFKLIHHTIRFKHSSKFFVMIFSEETFTFSSIPISQLIG